MNEQLRRAPSPDLLPRFAAIVGDKYAITDPAALEPFLVEGRGLYHGRSSMLLRPGSIGEVQAILKLANETKTPLVPQGGNTGLVGGQIPFDGELILSLTRLDRIREVDPASNAMTCEAGVVLARAQEAAAAVKLFPRPRAVETAFIAVPSPAAAVKLLNLAQARVGGTVTSFELIIRDVVEFAIKHAHGVRDPLTKRHHWYVLMEVSSQHGDGLRESVEQLLADGSAQGLVEDATIASSLDQAKAFWHMRHVLPEVQKPEGGSIKADVSVPVASVPQFLEEASAAAKAIVPNCRPVPFGHLGDGNVHFNVSQPIGADPAQFLARWGEVNDAVNKIVLKYNGSISAEHGIGKLKRDSLPKVKDPVALELMRGLKRMLDPNGILNPGKVL